MGYIRAAVSNEFLINIIPLTQDKPSYLSHFKGSQQLSGPVVEWIRHLTTNQRIAGSIPVRVNLFLFIMLCRIVSHLSISHGGETC